jgi:uncharacterized protein
MRQEARMTVHALRLTRDGLEPEPGAPAPDRILSGSPRWLTWNRDEGAGLHTGLWQGTPGCWRVRYDEWEYCRVIEGLSLVTPEGGVPITLGPGDSLVIRPGFAGTWEVVETTLKDYVIRLPG